MVVDLILDKGDWSTTEIPVHPTAYASLSGANVVTGNDDGDASEWWWR